MAGQDHDVSASPGPEGRGRADEPAGARPRPRRRDFLRYSGGAAAAGGLAGAGLLGPSAADAATTRAMPPMAVVCPGQNSGQVAGRAVAGSQVLT